MLLSYNKNLPPAVPAVCVGAYVSVRRCCSCGDELLLARGRDWLQGLPSKAVSQSIRLDRTFPGLPHNKGVSTDYREPHSLDNELFGPNAGDDLVCLI